jgi:transcriptional regulator with XRE-family HTH domain
MLQWAPALQATPRRTFHRPTGEPVDGRFCDSVLGLAPNTNILACPVSCVKSWLPMRGAMPGLFGQKLQTVRKRRRMTQAELAAQLSLASHSHIANLEAGRDVPSLSLVMKISRVLNVSTDYLVRDSIPVEEILEPTTEQGPDTEQHQTFGTKLRTLRLQRGWSQTDLARQLGLSWRQAIAKIETGYKSPSIDLLLQISDLFGVTTDNLLLDTLQAQLSSEDMMDET